MNENILLTITMLVSDREDTIEKCMKSLVHLRESVPSELIVVDTAGNEACMDIVRQYTDNIVRFEWCNDFAAARNAGVTRAKGKWLMYLDDDEWFESTEELENFFLSNDCNKYNAAAYLQRNYQDSLGIQWNDADIIRLVRREKGTCFVRRIHEYLAPIKDPVCYLHDYVHHYGYVYKSTEEKNKHYWRNIQLLLEEHKEVPQDTHTTAQLIQEYVGVEEYFSAIQLCKEIWMAKDCWNTAFNARYTTYAMMIEAKLYGLQKRYADGYGIGKEMLRQKGISILAEGIIYDYMVEFCWQLDKYEEALEYIDGYFACLKKWEKYPNKKSLDAFSACADYMSPKEVSQLSMMRLHLNVLLKDWKKAEAALLAVDWHDDAASYLMQTPADLIALLTSGSYHPAYISALGALYRKESMRLQIYSAIENLETENREVLLPYLHQISPEDVKLCSYHIIYAGKLGETAAAVPALEKMRKESYPLFLEEEEYWDSLKRLNVNINEYMPELSTYSWMELAKRLWALVPLKVCETAYVCLIRGLEKTDLRYIYLSALTVEKRLFFEEEQGWLTSLSPDEIWEKLNHLSQYWVSCAASLYREDVFMGELISAIPPCYQFGWYIMQANAVKNINLSLFLHKTADAAKAYPALKELCKKVIEGCKELL